MKANRIIELRFMPALVLALGFLLISITAKASGLNSTNEITINNASKELLAPEGDNYQWFHNGARLDNNVRSLKVSESGSYQVIYTDQEGVLRESTLSISVTADGIRKIYIIGDSTVQTYGSDKYPMMGWGQVFQLFFDESMVDVQNRAIGGRSSRSFWEEGRWDAVKAELDSNDYVFIQFGHNDRDWTKEERYTDTSAYKDYMRIYVNESREKGAIPVLVSPMIMNAWSGSTLRNVFTEGENDYRGAMLEVAEELDALFIDLNMKSFNLYKDLGFEYAAYYLHLGLSPGEYPNYPDGSTDVGTHFQEMGAQTMASLVYEGIEDLAGDEDMDYLLSAERPWADYTIEISDPLAARITRSGSFPLGAKVTAKVQLYTGEVFGRWEDAQATEISTNLRIAFLLNDPSYYYRAVVSDCNGEIGGTASYDDCLICSGGTTGKDPCVTPFESEDACDFTGRVQVRDMDFKRTLVNTDYGDGLASIKYSVEAAEAGTYDFTQQIYSRIEGQQVDIFLNGERVYSGLDLIQDGDWHQLVFQLRLEQGKNVIQLLSTSGVGGIFFDVLGVYSESLSAGDCVGVPVVNLEGEKARIYPNPFHSAINVEANGVFNYRIMDLSGKELLNGAGENTCQLGQNLEKGMYILMLENGDITHRQLVEKF